MAHGNPARFQKRHQGIFPRQDVQGEASASASASASAGTGFPKRVKSSQEAGPLLTASTSSSVAETSTSSSQTNTRVSTSTTSSTVSSPSTTQTTTSTSSSSTSSSSSSIQSTSSTTSSSTSTTSSTSTSSSSSSRRPLTTTSVPAQKSFAPTSQTSINDVLATTPFIISPSISSTDSQTLLPSETAQSSSAKGFLANKAAMAGTFSVVGLIGAGVLAVVLFTLWKKRSTFNRSGLMGGDESFKNFAIVEPEKAESSNGHDSFYSHGDHATADLTSHAPMDPFATSGPTYPAVAHYGSTHEQADPFADPTTSHNHSQQSLRDDSYLGYYTTNTNLPAPPPRGRNVLARSSIQPSIDSFYGAAY